MLHNFLTTRHLNYWAKRQIDWRQAYFNLDHPHRALIVNALKNIKFGSIIEIGCASGANLQNIKQSFPHVEIGGVDISKDAIDTALEIFGDTAAVLEVCDISKGLFLSDKSCDAILTDMVLIYLDPLNIGKALKEIKRVTRKNILLVEFHHTNWLKRFALRLFAGYNSYNYKKLLEKFGFHDIEFYKLTEKDWPGGNPQKDFGWLISAKV